MNSLISVNDKFFNISPKDLVLMINESKYTKGIEFCITNLNPIELKYLDDLVFELKRNNLILQIHGNSELPIEDQLKFINKLNDYSIYLGYKIILTMHPLYDDNKEISKYNTILYFENIINNINNDNIVLCIENLNDVPNLDRLEKESIKPISLNNENLYFTYDIGHEIIDHGYITDLDKYMIDKIRNVHIHSYNSKGNDHMIIYENDIHFNELLKGILFLKNNNYLNNIVFEYDVYNCMGDTIKDKVIDYLKSIDYVSEYL